MRPLQLAALDWLIEILESARQRKEMYFTPVGPVPVVYWLHGLRAGLSFVGVQWSSDHRRRPVEGRGIEYRAAVGESEELERRGLSPEAIVDELLAIEIEMWKSQRDDIDSEAIQLPQKTGKTIGEILGFGSDSKEA